MTKLNAFQSFPLYSMFLHNERSLLPSSYNGNFLRSKPTNQFNVFCGRILPCIAVLALQCKLDALPINSEDFKGRSTTSNLQFSSLKSFPVHSTFIQIETFYRTSSKNLTPIIIQCPLPGVPEAYKIL